MNVVSYRIKLSSFFDDLGWRDKNEFRFRINKPGDQPWTCHSIYFWAFTSNPTHRVFVSFGDGDLLSLVCCQRLRVDSRFDPFGQGECFSAAVIVKEDHPRIFAGHMLVNGHNVDISCPQSF